jgi:hypothetical protein
MLKLVVPTIELFDEIKQEFMHTKEYELRLEHSLVSLSKWESKWCKPFLTKSDKTTEETIDYIRCMTITQNVDPMAYMCIQKKEMDEVANYIDAPMTATTIVKEKGKITKEIITSEIIYYWMVSFNIPFECQTWHLNRLLTLINVCNIKNQPPKKMNRKEFMAKQKALNETRKAQYKTPG